MMNKEQMNNYAYKLMVKNNPDEAVKNLLLKDKKIERLNNIIDELEKYFAKPNKFIERPERMKILDKLKKLKEGK